MSLVCTNCGAIGGHAGGTCPGRKDVPDPVGVQSPLSESRLLAILDAQPARFRAGTQAGTR